MILWQDNKYIFKRTKQYTLFKDDDIKRLQIPEDLTLDKEISEDEVNAEKYSDINEDKPFVSFLRNV